MTQLDLDFVKTRRDDGIARAAEHSGVLWQDMALDAVRQYAASHEQFLTEDARIDARQSLALPEPTDGRAWGAVMQRARREKIIERIGYKPAKSSNLSPKPLWKSLICGVPA
jgi:hypothetical protein